MILPAARASPLARIVFLVYLFLVVYASLYPLAGWRDGLHGLRLSLLMGRFEFEKYRLLLRPERPAEMNDA